jgi:uncharacterized cupredoxin-like copper-binding protein
MRTPALALGTVVILLAGCGGKSSQNPASSASGGKTLTVVEKEFSLTPSTLTVAKPGTYTIEGVNKGQTSHAIAIDGQGVDETGPTVGPGGTSTITVTLTKQGDYDLYCPVGNHRQAGMQGTLRLGSGSSGGGMTTKDTSGGYG